MARNQDPPSDDPFYRRPPAGRNPLADDSLRPGDPFANDDEDDEQPQFRRSGKRVPVRRGALPRKTASRLRSALAALVFVAVLAVAAYQIHAFAIHSWRFRIRHIDLASDAPNSRAQVLEKMQEVMGRNIFQVSLAERKQALESIPWVASATVSRLWPNQLRVMVTERTPVAFIAIGERIMLIDAQGVLMELPTNVQSNYSFPVILGGSESDPLSTRAPRMKIFTRLMHELDGGDSGAAKAQYSRNLEEVDLSDPEDVKVVTKGGSGPVLLHLGNEDFLPRFMLFLTNVQKWESERGKLDSVDLRYGREVILNPDRHAAPPPPPPPPVATTPEAAPPPQKSAKISQQKKPRKHK